MTGNQEYRREVQNALAMYAGLIEKALLEMSWWLDAAEKLNGPFYEVVIAGETSDGAAELTATVLRTLPANAVLVRVPSAGPGPELAKLVPPAVGKKAADGKALAYVCEFGACQQPTSDTQKLLEQLAVGWAGAYSY